MNNIIHELEEQRDRVQQAIDALRGEHIRGHNGRRRGRRRLSRAARARISNAMKKRWALRKKGAQST